MKDKIIHYLKTISRIPLRAILPIIFIRLKSKIRDSYNYRKASRGGTSKSFKKMGKYKLLRIHY